MAERSVIARRQAFSASFGLALGLFTLLFTSQAFGGSYLSRASVLLQGAELEAAALRARFHDKELAEMTHRLAQSRLESARSMVVPKEVTRAHPHLLLVLESYERAADAAKRGQQTDFLVALARAREETSVFVAVLKQGGWDLPK